MADSTRRGFLSLMSITAGVGIAGGLGLHKFLAGDSQTAQVMHAQQEANVVQQPAAAGLQAALQGVTLAGPMLIHVRDVATGEVAMMVGTRELIYRDPVLVSRLVGTAQSANAKAEG
jgi:hypothetical protein